MTRVCHVFKARRPERLLTTLLLFGTVATAGPVSAAVTPEWAARWRDDLTFVAKTLPGSHADLFHTMPRDSFEARVERLRRAVPAMDHHEITVAIAELVAGVGDGHTRLTLPMDPDAGFFGGHSSTPAPKIEGLAFHHLPIRLYIYKGGVYVQRVAAAHGRAAGGRVLRIGRMTAEAAIAAVTPVVQRDNETQVIHLLPDFLVTPEVLAARGVIDGPGAATFEIETTAGKTLKLALEPVPAGETVEWVDARDATKPAPLYLRDPDSNYWFEYLEDDRIVYMKYNTVYDRDDESLEAFAGRLIGFIEKNDVQALVIDIRGNGGGNNSRNMPLLKGLIGCAKLQRPGSLFVITGRGTFSAAMMFAVDLEKFMNTVFVGEPTGASPNGYGDSRKLTLPNSGLTIRASSLHWQYSDPRDARASIEPHVPAPLTMADYRAGRDPALEAVRAIVAGPAGAPMSPGVNAGAIYSKSEVFPMSLAVDEAGAGATLSVPALGIDGAKVEHFVSDARQLAFDVTVSFGAVRVEARRMGGWTIGSAAVPANGSFMMLMPPR